MTATTGGRAVGWAPQWWRSGVRTPLWWLVGASALGWLYVTQAWGMRLGYQFSPAVDAWATLGQTAEILVGLLFWMWRPRNVVGPLLIAWSTLSQVGYFADFLPHSRLVVTVALLFSWVFVGVYVWMLFAFPNGTIWNRWALAVLILVFVWQPLLYLPALMFVETGVPTVFGSTVVPSYLYVGHGWSGVHAWEQVWWVVGAALWVLVDVVLIARLWRATPGARRRLLPLYGLVIALFTFIFIYNAVHVAQDKPWADWFYYFWVASFGTSAVGAAWGLSRVRHARGAVSDLVVELGEVELGGVRDAFAHTLGDPSLVLGLWLPDRGVWADEQGRELMFRTIARGGSPISGSGSRCWFTTVICSISRGCWSRLARRLGWRSRTNACRRSCAPSWRSCVSRGRGSSGPATRSGGGSSAISTTAPNSSYWPSGWACSCSAGGSMGTMRRPRSSGRPSRSSSRRSASYGSSPAASIQPC